MEHQILGILSSPNNVDGSDDESDGERISNLVDSRLKGKIQLIKYWSNNNTITHCHLIICILPVRIKYGLQYYKAINDKYKRSKNTLN